MALPPCFLTISRISLSGVATYTSPTHFPNSIMGVKNHWNIINFAKGLFGKRFAFKRVGIIIIVFFINNKIMRLKDHFFDTSHDIS